MKKKIADKKLKKTHTQKTQFFSLLPWAAQTIQTEEFMFQNVAYRPTVYKNGSMAMYIALPKCPYKEKCHICKYVGDLFLAEFSKKN